jgi:hypothetical protein
MSPLVFFFAFLIIKTTNASLGGAFLRPSLPRFLPHRIHFFSFRGGIDDFLPNAHEDIEGKASAPGAAGNESPGKFDTEGCPFNEKISEDCCDEQSDSCNLEDEKE